MKLSSNFKYIGSIKRSCSAAIDIFIANVIRMILFSVLGKYWLQPQIINFWTDFKARFDSDMIGKDPEKIHFLMQHQVFKSSLICLLLVFISGALYYVVLNSSRLQATVGRKLMKTIIINKDGSRLTLLQSSTHYFLSIVPWFFVFYIFTYQMMHGINLYNAITGNGFNLIFGLITLAWLQTHLITKKKTTAADMICGVLVVDAQSKVELA